MRHHSLYNVATNCLLVDFILVHFQFFVIRDTVSVLVRILFMHAEFHTIP